MTGAHARFAGLRFVLLTFLVSRAALFAIDLAAVYSLPERAPNWNKDYQAFPDSRFWDSFARWDSGWYHRIVERGYYLEGSQSNVAFFPAYPYLTRWLGALLGNTWAAGLLISNLAFLGALLFLFKLAQHYFDEEGSRRAVLLAAVFPTSCFFSAFYTESFFFFAVVGALYFYEKDEWLYAGLFGALATLTRSTGILLFPALLVGLLHRKRWSLKSLELRNLALFLIPAGLAVFMYLLHVQVGDALAFMKAQSGWGRASTFPLMTLVNEFRAVDWSFPRVNAEQVFLVIDLIATLGLLTVAAASWKRFDLAHTIFALLSVLVPLASGRVMSMMRFSACVVPVYLVLAWATQKRTIEQWVLMALSLFLALHAISFATWHWAG